jgi:hypothetical protein
VLFNVFYVFLGVLLELGHAHRATEIVRDGFIGVFIGSGLYFFTANGVSHMIY